MFVHGWMGAGLPPLDCSSNHSNYERPVSQNDAKGYFQGIGDQLASELGYTQNDIFYAQLVTNSCYTPPLESNAPNLVAAIDQAKIATGKSKVILIAHSMGGLVARAYIEGEQYRGDVDTLFTFGSPHLGTTDDILAFFLNGISLGKSCEKYQSAACDFSIVGMAFFNSRHNINPNVTYHVISGDAPFFSRNAAGMAMDALIPGPDDGAVPTDSGRATLLGTFDRWTTDELHGPGKNFGDHTYFISDGKAGNSYDDCIKKVLLNSMANCGSVSTIQAQPGASVTTTSTAPILSQHTPLTYGSLSAGQDATSYTSLEGGATLFAAQWQNGTLAFTLVNPDGNTIDSTYATNNPSLVTYTEDASGAATYYFPNATAGNWQAKLYAVTVPSGSASFTTFASFDSAVTLTGSTDNQWYAPDATATITATLGGSPSTATVTANVNRADGISDPLTFSAIGNGQYQAAYVVPNVPGYVDIQLSATGTTASSLPFERGTSLTFQISPNTFTLKNSYSETPVPYAGLSVYQYLNIMVGINAVTDGKVGLSADLVDSSGNVVAHSMTLQSVSAGTPDLTLQFNGTDIYASQHNGPYTLTNILLTDENGSTLVTQQANAVYTTAPYSYINFDNVSPRVVSVIRANPNPTSKLNVNFTVTFSEPVAGVDKTDFTLTKTGTLTGYSVVGVSGSGKTYTVTVKTGNGNGTLRLNVLKNGTIKDVANNPLAAGFAAGQVYTVNKMLTVYSNGTQDGWILEKGETLNVGGSVNSTLTTFRLGDDATKKQYRSILSFATGGLPDNAKITSIILKIKQAGNPMGGATPGMFQGFLVDARNGYFSTLPSLQSTDFQAIPSTPLAGVGITPSVSGGWYTFNLTTATKAYINKLAASSGLTQFRLRFKLDDNNNTTANFISFYSGNSATNKPTLVIQYYIP